jgi:ABC-type cobalt transport system substrate-binding protein
VDCRPKIIIIIIIIIVIIIRHDWKRATVWGGTNRKGKEEWRR